MDAETTTKFKGDIVFNDGEKDILVSDLATVEEVNEALNQCVTNESLTNTLTEYRKIDDFEIKSNIINAEILHNEEYDAYVVKGYDPKLPITLTIFWNNKEITATTTDSGHLESWTPDQTLAQELNLNVLTVRHMDMWNDSDNININDCSYWVMLMDRNWDIQYPKVLSAYQTLKEADELVLKSALNNYATKEEIIPYELIPVDEWQLKHNYRDAGHCDPVTITGLSMGDYVKIVVDNYSDEYPSKILQLGNVGDTEFSFEMFPGNSTITCTQTSENVVAFSNDMDDMYIWQIYTTTHMIKVPTSYTKLLEQIKSLEERIEALETTA